MAEAETREIYSLLAPMKEGRMLIPRASIAEVVGSVNVKGSEDLPSWFLGTIDWNQLEIPLVSLEGACGWGSPELAARSRVLVVLGLTQRLDPNFYAIVVQGHPHLVRVNSHVLVADELRMGEEALPLLARVRMANEKPVIPDLERMEGMIADALGRPDDGPEEPGSPDGPAGELAPDDSEDEAGLIAEAHDDLEEPGEATVNDLRGFKLGSDDFESFADDDEEDDDGDGLA